MAALREGEVREVEIPLRDKAYLTVLVPSLLTQQREQKAGLPQQSTALALLHSGFQLCLAGSLRTTEKSLPLPPCQGQSPGSIPTLTHSSASPSSMTSSHSPSVMVSSSSCPAWDPQRRIQDWLFPTPACLRSPPPFIPDSQTPHGQGRGGAWWPGLGGRAPQRAPPSPHIPQSQTAQHPQPGGQRTGIVVRPRLKYHPLYLSLLHSTFFFF